MCPLGYNAGQVLVHHFTKDNLTRLCIMCQKPAGDLGIAVCRFDVFSKFHHWLCNDVTY